VIGDEKWLSIAKPRAAPRTDMETFSRPIVNPYAV
jgi:hypothetical protein